MKDFDTFMKETGYNRIFRMVKLRRVGDWTPYEMDMKFSDESHYEDPHYSFIKIVETIELPDKDILIGYREVYEDVSEIDSEEWESYPIHYRKLSQIELSFFPEDMETEEDEEN